MNNGTVCELTMAEFTLIATVENLARKASNGIQSAAEVYELRQRYWANGYRPVPIWNPDQQVNDKGEPLRNPGKQPRGLWRRDAKQDPPVAAVERPDKRALNTGVLTDECIGIDNDVPDPALAEKITAMIVSILGETPLIRVGQTPKTLLVYRAEKSFRKVETPELFLPNGTKSQVEVLAKGQQFVAHGIHPVTGTPYRWTDETPEDVHISLLPIITEQQAREVVRRAEQLLREAGAAPKTAEPPPRMHNGSGANFFKQVNAAALANASAWVRLLFPRARFEPGTGAWRVSSKDLERDLQEDISIHPEGVQDWGERIGLTPLDLVMQYGKSSTPIEAALWLCDRLSIDPATMGYTPPRPRITPAGLSRADEDINARPPAYSDEALALRFAGVHGDIARYVATWGKWLLWDGFYWQFDDTLRAFNMARVICRIASAEITDPKLIRLAAAVASAKTVTAIIALARADRRHAATCDLWDSDPWNFTTKRR